MEKFLPEELIVESGSESSPIYQNLRRTLPQVPVKIVEDVGSATLADFRHGEFFGAAKKKLYLMRHRGEFFKKCPGSDGQVCCNYFVINFASNCPMDCTELAIGARVDGLRRKTCSRRCGRSGRW